MAAYVFAAAFDVLSVLKDYGVAPRGGGVYVLVGGAVASALAMLTGWADWHRSSQVGTQARRTINAHAVLMIGAAVLVLVDIAVRLGADGAATGAMVLLSVAAAAVTTVGATYGGSLVFDYGFNVESSATTRSGTSPRPTCSPATTDAAAQLAVRLSTRRTVTHCQFGERATG